MRRAGSESANAVAREEDYVAYGGAILIPFCVGSVALPLSLCRASTKHFTTAPKGSCKSNDRRKKRHRHEAAEEEDGEDNGREYCTGISRCTHVRYMYLRDGACSTLDLSYRRELYLNSSSASGSPSSPALDSSRTSDVAAVPASSASTLYALVDHVVFILPIGFPERRRELSRPPFFIVDDAWAEHMVELEVHFHPWLGIEPTTISHFVPLQRRADIPPSLLSSTQGQSKPPSTVILSPSESKSTALSGESPKSGADAPETTTTQDNPSVKKTSNYGRGSGDSIYDPELILVGEHGISVKLVDLPEVPVVSERRDAIRIFHPTLDVVRYVAKIRSKPQPELLAPPQVCPLPWQGGLGESEAPLGSGGELTGNVHAKTKTGAHANHGVHSQSSHGLGIGSRRDEEGVVSVLQQGDVLGNAFPAYCFPVEAIIHAHEPVRQRGAVEAMTAVREALKQEQKELRASIERCIAETIENAAELRAALEDVRRACEALRTPG
ncbi:hypothetical protein TRVL_02070 [Trypanosoma vivax]|nr:hypothetical protein TRVL_02070 [Trypanosoma vivax]